MSRTVLFAGAMAGTLSCWRSQRASAQSPRPPPPPPAARVPPESLAPLRSRVCRGACPSASTLPNSGDTVAHAGAMRVAAPATSAWAGDPGIPGDSGADGEKAQSGGSDEGGALSSLRAGPRRPRAMRREQPSIREALGEPSWTDGINSAGIGRPIRNRQRGPMICTSLAAV